MQDYAIANVSFQDLTPWLFWRVNSVVCGAINCQGWEGVGSCGVRNRGLTPVLLANLLFPNLIEFKAIFQIS